MPLECPLSAQFSFECSSIEKSQEMDSFMVWTSPPLFIRGLEFLKNHRRRWPRLSCKKGEGSPYRGEGVYIKGEYCFSLIRYEFFWSNALYSASLSFRMFIFLLTAFDTWECDSFGLNLSQVLLIKVLFFKKACNIAF